LDPERLVDGERDVEKIEAVDAEIIDRVAFRLDGFARNVAGFGDNIGHGVEGRGHRQQLSEGIRFSVAAPDRAKPRPPLSRPYSQVWGTAQWRPPPALVLCEIFLGVGSRWPVRHRVGPDAGHRGPQLWLHGRL